MDLASLMEIKITSAGRKEQNLSDVTAAVYVIDQEKLKNLGVTTLPEALRMVPGIQDIQNIFLEDVERIEVIRGPGATLW